MTLGGAILLELAKILLGYLVWVAVVTLLVAFAFRRRSRTRDWPVRLGIWLVLVAGPPVTAVLWLRQQSANAEERRRVDQADRAAAAAQFAELCAAPAAMRLVRTATGRQPEILVIDSEAGTAPTLPGIPMSPPGTSVLFLGSPFSVVLQRVPLDGDDRLCRDVKAGYQCKDPTHAFRLWRGQFENRASVATWDADLHFTLTLSKPAPTATRFIETQTLRLAEDHDVLAEVTVNRLDTGGGGPASHCPSRDAMIQSMIRAAFPAS